MSGADTNVENLKTRIGELVRERQTLRVNGADRSSLEGNRRELALRQAELGRALIAQHCAAPA
jgi:hypothetical protein